MEAMPLRCKWIERNDEGRPRCIHGWAIKAGPKWRCSEKHRRSCRKNYRTDAAKARKHAWNNSDYGRSSKRLYDLTKIRLY